LKSIEETAKEIKYVIDEGIEKNFMNILNDHNRISMG
jgi:hypothetical protein